MVAKQISLLDTALVFDLCAIGTSSLSTCNKLIHPEGSGVYIYSKAIKGFKMWNRYCVIPENIHTSPMEGIISKTPPPPPLWNSN